MYSEINSKNHYWGVKSTYWGFFFTAIFIAFYLWDIGNILAPRQGTESLYVQISKEMYETSSWLTPVYRGEAHWSKPPLQYWLPMPLYALFGGFSLTLARLSMALLSFSTVGGVFWLLRRQKIELNFIKFGAIFLSSFGMLKFSRIFMMEIPLSLFPLIGALCFYDYLQSRSKITWLLSVVCIGLGGLVKGPVSLAMGFASMFLYVAYLYFVDRKNILKEFFIVSFAAFIISSLWYVLCYQKYGMEFVNYFFLRENLGKFGQQKSMSAIKIIQGLFLYTFPWFHLISFRQIRKKLENPLYIFLGFHFIVFFFIWFIPSQKSHHYAMPGFVFWMMFLLNNSKSFVRNRMSRFLFWGQVSLLLFVSITFLYFSNSLLEVAFALLPILSILFCINLKVSSLGIGISFVALFTVLVSRFYLPLIPNRGVEMLLKNQNVQVFYNDRRPFFLEERLGRKVELYDQAKLHSGDYILTPKNKKSIIDINRVEKIYSWGKWKRKAQRNDVINAFFTRDLSALMSSYILYKVK